MQNRLRWHLHELDPEIDPHRRTAAWTASSHAGPARRLARPNNQRTTMVARLAAELIADIRALTVRARALEREITRPA